MNYTDENKILGISDENKNIKEIRDKFNVPDLSYLMKEEPAKPIVQHLNMVDTGFGMHPDEFNFSNNQVQSMEVSDNETVQNGSDEIEVTDNEVETKQAESSKTVNILEKAKEKIKSKKLAANPDKLINETEYCAKLKRPIVEGMLHELNSKAFDLLMLFGMVQDKYGVARGVDYKYYANLLGISYPTFYSCLKELSSKGFIKYEKELECKTSYKVTIVNNDFSHVKKSDHASYLSLNIEMFVSPEYLNLSILKRKILVWCQLNIGGSASKFKKKGRTISRDDLAAQLNITSKQSLDRAMKELEDTNFYSANKNSYSEKKRNVKLEIDYNGGFAPTTKIVRTITRKNQVSYTINEINIVKNNKPEFDYYLENMLRLYAKINKLTVSAGDKSEIVRLGHQYKKLGVDMYLQYCVLSYEKFGTFEKKYVCKCCSNQLKENKAKENIDNKEMSLRI